MNCTHQSLGSLLFHLFLFNVRLQREMTMNLANQRGPRSGNEVRKLPCGAGDQW